MNYRFPIANFGLKTSESQQSQDLRVREDLLGDFVET